MYTNTNTNTNTNANARRYYALVWAPANAYRYADAAIRVWGAQIATVYAFDRKAARDAYTDNDPYAQPIKARRAYRIGGIIPASADMYAADDGDLQAYPL